MLSMIVDPGSELTMVLTHPQLLSEGWTEGTRFLAKRLVCCIKTRLTGRIVKGLIDNVVKVVLVTAGNAFASEGLGAIIPTRLVTTIATLD
jgi:hypothetical protein